jgi:ankyrin repeat protein
MYGIPAKVEAVVRRLLAAGADADINTQDGSLQTPLHEACFNGYKNVCLLLLEHDARLDVVDVRGEQ